VNRKTGKVLALMLSFLMAFSVLFTGVPLYAAETAETPAIEEAAPLSWPTEILNLPIARFELYGAVMDRAPLIAEVSNGVFLSWRYFPQEMTSYVNYGQGMTGRAGSGLRGNNFHIYRDGLRISNELIVRSTDFHDPDGSAANEYIIVTVAPDGTYISRTVAERPFVAARAAGTPGQPGGYFFGIPLTRPAATVQPANNLRGSTTTINYIADEIMVGDFDGSGELGFVIKWQNQNFDVIQSGTFAPVIYQAVRRDGTVLWEINMGINVRAGQHYGQPMFYNFRGDGRYVLMVQSAPGTRDALGNYITLSPETLARGINHNSDFRQWDRLDWNAAERAIRGNNPDVTTGGGNITPAVWDAATPAQRAAAEARIEQGEFFQSVVDFFLGWNSHEDVIRAPYWGNVTGEVPLTWLPDEDQYALPGVHIGWWVSPPQVMLGMFAEGHECPITGNVAAVDGAMATFEAGRTMHPQNGGGGDRTNFQAPGWSPERFERLNNLPKCPVAFRRMTITREMATDLTWQMFQFSFLRRGQNYTNDRGFIQFGHVMDAPMYMTAFCGETGAEISSVLNPIQIDEYGGQSIRWNDWTFTQPEPWNRSHRFLGAVGYLHGHGERPSKVQIRGYYSRGTVTGFHLDSNDNLVATVIHDTGFEVLPNPFNAQRSGNYFVRSTQENRHGAPGRWEPAFDPARTNLAGVRDGYNTYGPLNVQTSTIQGQHSMSVWDVDRTSEGLTSGFDTIIIGSAAYNAPRPAGSPYVRAYSLDVPQSLQGMGSVRWSGHFHMLAGTEGAGTDPRIDDTWRHGTGGLEKFGHGDAMHAAFFHPSQTDPAIFQVLEGGRLDWVLQNIATGEVMYVQQRATAGGAAWHLGGGGDVGRGMVGDFTNDPGWVLHGSGGGAGGRFNTPMQGVPGSLIGPAGGFRQFDGWTPSHTAHTAMPNNFSIQFTADLSRQVTSGTTNVSLQRMNADHNGWVNVMSTSGTRTHGGTKGQPALVGDILGDHRENLLLHSGTGENQELRIFFSAEQSHHRLASHMTDRRYRVEMARQNTVYNQPTYPSYYVGRDMDFGIYYNTLRMHMNSVAGTVHEFRTVNAPETARATVNATFMTGVYPNFTPYQVIPVVRGRGLHTIEFPPDPYLADYVFTGWVDADGNPLRPTLAVWENINIYPTFSGAYYVTFMVDGEEHHRVAIVSGTAIGAANMPANPPVPENHLFRGWFTELNGEGTAVNAATVVTEAITAHAFFEAINVPPGTAWRFSFVQQSNVGAVPDGWVPIISNNGTSGGVPLSANPPFFPNGTTAEGLPFGITSPATAGNSRDRGNAVQTGTDPNGEVITWPTQIGNGWRTLFTFRIDVPNGIYDIVIGTGSANTDNTNGGSVIVNGQTVPGIPNVGVAAAPQLIFVYGVEVTDGSIVIQATGDNRHINGFTITKVTEARTPILEWWEDFEHNTIRQLQWTFAGGTRVPSANNRGNTLLQAIVPSGHGDNSDPGSRFMGRFTPHSAANVDRQGRINFNEPIHTSGEAHISFDWRPGVATGSYGQLAIQSINHFNSLNYISFLTIPEGRGVDAGLHFVVGTTQNVAVDALVDAGRLPAENFITADVNQWLRVNLDFDFAARTMDFSFVTMDDTVIFNRTNVAMADEDYQANQITGIQFFSRNQGGAAWTTYIDNVNVRVYDEWTRTPPRGLPPFGMPQNVIYSPVTSDSVTITWNGMQADGFFIYRRHAADAANSLARIATVTDGFIFVDNTVVGPFYYYAVRAFQGPAEAPTAVSPRTREAFIQLAPGKDDVAFTMISEFETASVAGFSNRIRLGDLTGDGRMDILLINTLPMGGRNWAAGHPNWVPAGTVGDGTNSRVVFSVSAFDIEGNLLWQNSADTGMTGFTGHSREISTGADEPAQIADVTGDGFNNVILVANPGNYVPEAPPWINSVPAATLANPEFIMPTNYVNRFYQVAGDVFYILDGRTGEIALDVNGRPMYMPFADMTQPNGEPITNINQLHDHITLADLDGRGIRQHVIMSARYNHTTAWEMINRDGEFVMRFMWQFPGQGAGFGDGSPHFPLAVPLFRDQGDQRDWIVNNFNVLNPETGIPLWHLSGTAANPFRDANGEIIRTNAAANTWDPGAPVWAANHMDSIWVADLLDRGQYDIIWGIDNDNMGVLATDRYGNILWSNFCATETQSGNPGRLRTDADGLMVFGLDRRHRGDFPVGHDGIFYTDPHGNTVFVEESNFNGWMTTTLAVQNWTGTFSTMAFGFNRNYHMLHYRGGGGTTSDGIDLLPATFFDGYFNPLFGVPEMTDWAPLRWIPADLMGDSREELVSFSDRGHIFIFANGEQSATDGMTGRPHPMTNNLMNWTRYNVGYFTECFSQREPAQMSGTLVGGSIDLTWVPIINAESYRLYKNGVLVRQFNVETDNLRYTVTGLSATNVYKFTITASATNNFGQFTTTIHSKPLVINGHLGEVSFTVEQIGGVPGQRNTTALEFVFNRPVTGLVAEDIIVQGLAGGGRIKRGALTGEGTTWRLEVDDVLIQGEVRVFVVDFGEFFVTNTWEFVNVYKGDEIGQPVFSWDIFNNGPEGSPSRPNAGLANAGTIRMWTQLDGVNSFIPYESGATITATIQSSGECAMDLITVHSPGPGQGVERGRYINFIDADKNAQWKFIDFVITVFDQTVEVLLHNANYAAGCEYCPDCGECRECSECPEFSFDIFNNGPGGTPSRPNASLAAAGTIRMWTQFDGRSTRLPFTVAETVTAIGQNGDDAMDFVRINRLWVAGEGFIEYFHIIDVVKNPAWRTITLTITVCGTEHEVLLVNANYEEPPVFDCIYCEDEGCEVCQPEPPCCEYGDCEVCNPILPTFYLAANNVTVSNTNRHVSVFVSGTAEGAITLNLLDAAPELVLQVRDNLWTPTGPVEGLVIGVAGNATIIQSRTVSLEVTRGGVTALLTIELVAN